MYLYPSKRSGFAMMEVLLAIVIFGVFLTLIFPALATLDQLRQKGRTMGRQAAAVPVQESLIAGGYDPATVRLTSVPSLLPVRNAAPQVTKTLWSNKPGSLAVWLLQGATGDATGNKLQAFGFQLGQGTDIPPRGLVVPPVPPVVVGLPTLAPAGPSLNLAGFLVPPVHTGDPWSIQISATAPDATSVVKLKFQGIASYSATRVASVSLNLNASEIIAGGTVEAWAEFAGLVTDTAELLADGRTRWWTASKVYDPSAKVAQTYRVSIGSPTLFINGVAYASGSSVPMTWILRSTVSSAYVGYDPVVLSKLGSAPLVSVFDVAFNSAALAPSSDVIGIFGDPMLPSWLRGNTLSARPLGVPSSLDAASGNWAINETAIALADPDLLTPSYDAAFAIDGIEQFAAPLVNGVREGRVQSGETSSLGPVLELTVKVD